MATSSEPTSRLRKTRQVVSSARSIMRIRKRPVSQQMRKTSHTTRWTPGTWTTGCSSPMTNIRLAFTTGMARPNFYDLVPYRVIIPEDNQINEGNSTLKPTKATSLDLMGEHYFQAIGMISGGVFYKKLDDIIFTQTTRVVGGTYDGWYLSQPINGGTSTLIGY